MPRRALIPLSIALGLLLVATATVARATTISARGHGVTATLSYRGGAGAQRDLALTIGRGQRTLYRAPVRAPLCGTLCEPQTGTIQNAVQIADLDDDGAADVLLSLYSGGANCCSILQVFTPSAAMDGRYVHLAQRDFFSAGYRLERIGGRLMFVTADNTFETTFTDFAASGLPLQILRLSGARFLDVTSAYPALIRRDAARWLTAYRRADGRDDVGLIAAWAADEARLGRWSAAQALLVDQARAGRLNSALYPRSDSGLRFVTRLTALLGREGYLG
jgi:hypothetical protein